MSNYSPIDRLVLTYDLLDRLIDDVINIFVPVSLLYNYRIDSMLSCIRSVTDYRRRFINLVPRVLSLLGESTLVTAGHLSARF